MGILNKLQNQGSIFTNLDGTTPQGFNTQASVLDPQSLIGSQLDLDGKTPLKYVDNQPK
jgi:hypothetical protein